MGGIAMLSAGLIGGPGLGYGKDRFAAETLATSNPPIYTSVMNAETPSNFLIFQEVNAIDGTKLEEANKAVSRTPDQDAIVAAGQAGDRMTLKADSAIPMALAVIYLLILLYFKSIGGYKVVTIDEMPDEKASLRD